MAFNGYLIKVGTYEIPMEYIGLENYKVTPNMRMDLDPFRDANGVLTRNVVPNQTSKIEINTPYLYGRQLKDLMTNLYAQFSNTAEKKASVTFYCPDTDSYKTENMYCPDFVYEIYKIDLTNYNRTIYKPFRLAFIGY